MGFILTLKSLSGLLPEGQKEQQPSLGVLDIIAAGE
jgi:hypothetical protein